MNALNLQNKKRAVIYCRVSTKDQVEEGNSLSTQQKICKEFCLRNDYDIAEIFLEQGESAKTAERTELQKLLTFCANKKNLISAVVIYKIDRLSRNTDDYSQLRLLLKRYGVEIKSTSEYFENTPVGRFMENTMANIAQFDNDVRTERSVGGMREAMREGRYVWKAPLGYNNVRIGNRSTISPDEKLFPLLRQAFELIAQNRYLPEGVRTLMRERGLVNREGNPVSKSFFYHTLKNEVYTGWISKFGERHKGLFEPLVTESIFEQVQRVLKRRGNRGVVHKGDHADFPLRRFVSNEHGKKLTGSWSQGRNSKYPYYRFCTKNSNYSRDKFEADFMDFMDNFGLREEYIQRLEELLCKHYRRSTENREKELGLLKNRIEQLKNKQTAVINKNLLGIISDEVLKQQMDLIDIELLNANEILSGTFGSSDDFNGIPAFVKEYLKKPSKIWRSCGVNIKIKLQWFEFPSGVIFENNSFRTGTIVNIFKLKSHFSSLESYKGYFDVEIPNTPEITSHEYLDKIRLEINALSEILREKEVNNDAPG